MAEGTVTQPAYVPRLMSALETAIGGAHVTAERVRGDRFRFVVVSETFDGEEHPKRQRAVWDVADSSLPKQDLLNVAMIITLSPSEL